MSTQRTDERPAALAEFMSELRALRTRAGDPSFRQMAAKSGAVSHATLHLTVTGYRLQPWETVREFVRACDGDEQEWHAKWGEVHAALSGDELAEDQLNENDASAEVADDPEPASDRRRPFWRSPRVLIPAALGLLAGGVVVGMLAFGPFQDDAEPVGRATQDGTSDAPVYPGDSSRLVDDVTFEDGTKVEQGAQFVKVWEMQNTGTVAWRNRFLLRADPHAESGDCHTPPRIPINNTAPGQRVQITVTVDAPERRTNCTVYWKMVDRQNRTLLPANRPLYFQVRVRP